MAYMNQEKKKVIVKNIKKEFPTKDGWKFSFSVQNSMVLQCRILSAPLDYRKLFSLRENFKPESEVLQINNPNTYNIERGFKGTKEHDSLIRIWKILNETNHDNSDIMTDYFDVGYYVDLEIGYENYNSKGMTFTPFKYVGE